MSEVLTMVYEASGPSIRVELDAVREVTDAEGVTRTVTVLGRKTPERHLTLAQLDELDAELASDLRSVLLRLEPIVRGKTTIDAASPERVVEEAARVARERQELERQKSEAARLLAEAAKETARQEVAARVAAERVARLSAEIVALEDKKKKSTKAAEPDAPKEPA